MAALPRPRTAARAAGPVRLHLGCGPVIAPGWLNSDRRALPGVDVCCDVARGLPFAAASFDAVAAIHLLQDLEFRAVPGALLELHRILQPGGWLRVGVPDLDRAIAAYMRGDRGYFYIGDGEARTLGAKLVTQIVWYGSVRTPMTFDCLGEWLERAGFRDISRCAYGASRAADPELADLDTRPRESLFVEARR